MKRRILLIEAGPTVEAVSKFSAPLPAQQLGKHLWVYISMHRCADPTADRFLADIENLLTIEGPCRFWCEEGYTTEIAARPCKGTE